MLWIPIKKGILVKPTTYAESGVDIFKEEQAIKELLSSITSKRQGIGKPLGGHYAGMIEFGEYALVLCTDGVGSKVEIANQMKTWNTVGIDCIAMNVNDALCVGAEPLAFVDYLALEVPSPEITREIGKGLQKGAELSNISIIGGETASLPSIIKGFDLAGTCLAYVKKTNIITGENIQPGDAIIGLSSSGIHSNGYSLVRNIIKKNNLSYTDTPLETMYPGQTLGSILLTPTRIYVKEIIELFHHVPVKGLAHITGSGLFNLPRLKKDVQYVLDNPLPVPPIFSFLQQQGNVTDTEMYQTFNMGMGFAVIVSKKDTEKTLQILQQHSIAKSQIVGSIAKGTGVTVPSLQLRYL